MQDILDAALKAAKERERSSFYFNPCWAAQVPASLFDWQAHNLHWQQWLAFNTSLRSAVRTLPLPRRRGPDRLAEGKPGGGVQLLLLQLLL